MGNHAKDRAIERYNINLSHRATSIILDKIRNNDMIPLGTSEKDKTMKFAYVVYKNIPLKVLYKRSIKQVQNIITIYPFDCEEYNEVVQDDFQSKIDLAVALLKANGYIVYKRGK